MFVLGIQEIQRIAYAARQQLKKSFNQSKKMIETLLRPITHELQEKHHTGLFTEIDLEKWMNRLKELKKQLEKPSTIEVDHDEDEVSATHFPLIQLRILQNNRASILISNETKWSPIGHTIAGGQGRGAALNQLNCPYGLDVNDDGTVIIADMENHRIMRWKPNARQGEIITGGKGQGNRIDQLDRPAAVLIDRINNRLIISDWGNRRVMQFFLDKNKQNTTKEEVIIANVASLRLAIDSQGCLYVSDVEKQEVRRYGSADGAKGVVVAGGNGSGDSLNQLNCPRHIFIDDDYSVYVTDSGNHRVMKWVKNATEGVFVAGGHDKGKSLGQLCSPSGILIDRTGSIYVADQLNHRVIRWSKGAKQGDVILGGETGGSENNQLFQPTSISTDDEGNLYVADRSNHRVQRFDLQ